MPQHEITFKTVAITGTDASGKDLYAQHLEDMGFMHVSAGDVLRNAARAQGHLDPIPRIVLSEVGDQMKAKFGSAPIVLSSIETYSEKKDSYPAGLVISGLRRVAEVKAFKERGAYVLFVDADPQIRFARQLNRKGREKSENIEDFLRSGQIEYLGQTSAELAGVYLQGVERLADVILLNNGEQADFFEQADKLIAVSTDRL